MESLYLENEERFGRISSFLYSIVVRIRPIQELYDFIVEDLEGRGYNSVLDVGTGTGAVPIMLSNVSSAPICAIDPSVYMINIAKRKAGKGTKIRFRIGSSRHVPFKEKFDVIISSFSFHHWAEKEKSLIYLKGFLAKGGEIRIYENEASGRRGLFNPISSHSIDVSEVYRIAKNCGLRVAGVKRHGRYVRISIKPK
jgi:ubiquinone/menaquinone biosynthesis C-methylase UbiE